MKERTISNLKKHGFVVSSNRLTDFELTREFDQQYKYRGVSKTRKIWSAVYFKVNNDGTLSGFKRSSNLPTEYYKNITFDEWLKV